MIIRRPWTRQPQTVVGIDWSNPLARGLARAYLPSAGIDLLAGLPTTKSAPSSVGRSGVAVEGNSSGFVQWPQVASKLGGDYTIIAIAETAVADYVEQYLYCEGNAFATTGNAMYFYRASGESKFYINGRSIAFSAVPASTPVVIGTSVQSGVASGAFDFSVYNGVLSKTAAYTITSVGGSLSAYLGKKVTAAADAVAFSASTKVYALFTWARALSDAELLLLSRNSWELFAPQTSRIWVPSAAAGAAPTISDLKTASLTYQSVQATYDYAF